MNEWGTPDLALGGVALAVAIFYAAWREYAVKNQRDAKLLTAFGAISLMGGTLHWLH